MKKLLSILGLALLLPMAALAEGGTGKQADKVEKDATAQAVQHGDKQDKTVADALDTVRFEFMRSNLISTFYHELAHALIDIRQLPILGQEEDAADVFSVLMVERLFPEGEAIGINKGAAIGFKVNALDMRAAGHKWDWADEHGHHMQRYYNIVCLTFGAAPKRRADFASEMKLPEDRTKVCKDEFVQASHGWDPIIDRLSSAKNSNPIEFRQSARTALQLRAAEVMAGEVKRFNEKYNLPDRLRVLVKRCERRGNTYAFYSPSRKKITICTNYIDELYRDAPQL